MSTADLRTWLTIAAVCTASSCAISAQAQQAAFITACEEALKARLKTPESYRRVAITNMSHLITLDDFLTNEPSTKVRELYRRMGAKPIRAAVALEYESISLHGPMVRGRAYCSYDTVDGDASRATAAIVKINGKTATDHLVDSIKHR